MTVVGKQPTPQATLEGLVERFDRCARAVPHVGAPMATLKFRVSPAGRAEKVRATLDDGDVTATFRATFCQPGAPITCD